MQICKPDGSSTKLGKNLALCRWGPSKFDAMLAIRQSSQECRSMSSQRLCDHDTADQICQYIQSFPMQQRTRNPKKREMLAMLPLGSFHSADSEPYASPGLSECERRKIGKCLLCSLFSLSRLRTMCLAWIVRV